MTASTRDEKSAHTSRPRRIIVVGGGFGGLFTCRGLRNSDAEILLIDRRNYHLFQPLLYQVAMAGLSPAEIAIPIRSVFRKARNIQVIMAEVQRIHADQNRIETDQGSFEYDELVLACGAEHSYFSHPEWRKFAPGLKTIEHATEIRRRVLTAFERAEAETDRRSETIRPWLTFVIVGGGPTGVELAGALGEITRFTLNRDFRQIDPRVTRIILVEAGERILGGFAADLAQKAMRDLENLGVQTWTGCRVTEVTENGVRIGNEWIDARTVIWAAGVKPSPLNLQLGEKLDSLGRIEVKPNLSLSLHPNIFVIGDQANVKDKNGQPLPGVAPVAMQQGRWLAKHLLKPKAHPTFEYFYKGQVATI
jgi:NADH dehydrogenase